MRSEKENIPGPVRPGSSRTDSGRLAASTDKGHANKSRAALERELQLLASQEQQQQEPLSTGSVQLRKTDTPGAPRRELSHIDRQVKGRSGPAVPTLTLAALRRPVDDMMPGSPFGLPPSTASARPASVVRPGTATSRASTAMPPQPAQQSSSRPSTGLSELRRELDQQLAVDGDGALRARLAKEIVHADTEKEFLQAVLRKRAAPNLTDPAQQLQAQSRGPEQQLRPVTSRPYIELAAPTPCHEPAEEQSSERHSSEVSSEMRPPSSRSSDRASRITTCSKGRVQEARAAQSTIDLGWN